MICQIEVAGEGPPGYAAIEEGFVARLLNPTFNSQTIVRLDELNVFLAKARHRHDNTVLVFAELFNVVGGISAIFALKRCGKQAGQTIKSNGRPKHGREIECRHDYPP